MNFTADQVRQTFIDFFVAREHEHVPSASLVPAGDPTLLFTNAGMNQFKAVFLGEATRPYSRAVTVQKCMRVSGKHNDLETVGPSLAHHTFFEMLGNFSFGDYFKAEAIRMAWELMTEGYGLPRERLWATVYEQDDEAERLWQQETDLLPGRVVRLGKKDNYWSMGETGPCGPCSELHYDYEWDGTPVAAPDFDSDRFVELWNLVFMQFNAAADGTVTPLPRPNIDTGAGLERLAAVLQGTRSNYDTDLFQPLIEPVAAAAGRSYGQEPEADVALRVIADHSRALAFLLADGVMPANEGRGYVLRRLLRRAMRFGMKLGFEAPFLYENALRVVETMGHAYPELPQRRRLIERVTRAEEERFLQTLAAGSQVFNELVARLRREGCEVIPGEEAFRLYDTHGLPLELTREFAAAEKLAVDEAGFERAMASQRARARSAWKGGIGEPLRELLRGIRRAHGPTEFLGYEQVEVEGASVLALLADGALVEELGQGAQGEMIVDRTPFYAESGGQVGDRGCFATAGGGSGEVLDTTRPVSGLIVHRVRVDSGSVRVGDRVDLAIDAHRRERTRRNHTATHLLHAALRERLGEHVRQAGSLVEPDRLRFDFTHFEPVTGEQLEEMEWEINRQVLRDLGVDVSEMSYREAVERGALAFFGEKYGDRVRVVTVPGVSMELCGGTHVERTGQIGPFLIVREESVAAGTRRIEALTGESAVQALQRYRRTVRDTAARLRAPEEGVVESVQRLSARTQEVERELEALRVKVASQEAGRELGAAERVGDVAIVRREVDGLDAAGMRALADDLKRRLGSGVVVLAARRDGKASLVVGVTSDLAGRLPAGEVVRRLASILGGGGGGHGELAQAGGPDAAKVADALERVPQVIRDLLE